MSNKIANIGAEKMFLAERINANVAHRLVVDTWRTFDAVSPRQCPTKNYRLAITTLRTPDARSAQSNNVIVGSRLNAPTLRCRCVVTTRLSVKMFNSVLPRRYSLNISSRGNNSPTCKTNDSTLPLRLRTLALISVCGNHSARWVKRSKAT